MTKRVFLLLLTLFFCLSEAVAAPKTDADSLPRMASLRSSLVNARSGPGRRYPVDWIYTQRGAPVEIIQEYVYEQELWYQIKDWENSTGWVHHTMISNNRFAKVITQGENNLYARQDYKSKVIARVESDVVGAVKKCPKNEEFCLIKFSSIEGWMPKKDIFGVYKDEVIE